MNTPLTLLFQKSLKILSVLAFFSFGLQSQAAITGFPDLTVNTIQKHSAKGTSIGSVSITTNTPGTDVTFNIVGTAGSVIQSGSSGNGTAFYFVGDGVGATKGIEVFINNKTHISFATTYTFRIEAVQGTSKDTALFTITVPAARRPEFQALVPYQISENLAANTLVQRSSPITPNIVANDFDSNDSTLVYSILSTNPAAAPFTLVQNNGICSLRASSSLNYEVRATYTINILVTDIDGLKDTAAVTVNVLDVNEPPVINSTTLFRQFREDVTGNLFTFDVTDPDANASNHMLTYSIISQTGGSGSSPFAVDSGATRNQGRVRVNDPNSIDFESMANSGKNITLTIRVADNGGISDTVTFTVNITDNPNESFAVFNGPVNGVTISNDCNKLNIQLSANTLAPNLTTMRSACGFGTGASIYFKVDRVERSLESGTWTNLQAVQPEAIAFDWNGSTFTAQSPTINDFGAVPGKEYAYRVSWKVGSQVCNMTQFNAGYLRGNYPGKPAAPRDVRASTGNANNACTDVMLNWSNAGGFATGIRIIREENVNFNYQNPVTVANNLPVATTSYRDSLAPANRGKRFRYSIIALNTNTQACEQSDPARSADAYSLGLPIPPKDLVGTVADGCTSVDLNWVNQEIETSVPLRYYVYKTIAETPTPITQLVDSVNIVTESYSDLNPNLGKVVTYTVRGINSCGIGPTSNTAQFNLEPLGRSPSSVTSQTVVNGNAATLRLTFSPLEINLPHRVVRNDIELANLPIGTTTYDDITAQPCELNEYKIGAVNGCGLGNTAMHAARINPPLNLQAITATDGKFPDKIELRWQDIAFEDNYSILKDNQQIFQTAKDVSVYTDENSLPGELHTYSVIATNACSTSTQQQDLGFADPNGSISGHISTPGGQFVEGVEVSVTPVIGNAIKLNGSPVGTGQGLNNTAANAYVDLNAGGAVINTSNGLTLEGWFRVSNNAATTTLLTLSSASGTRLMIQNPANTTSLIMTSFACDNSGCPIATNTPNGLFITNTWFHLSVTINQNGQTRIYKDGQLIVTNNNGAAPFSPTTAVTLGNNAALNSSFNGFVDDFRIWNLARTAAQIFETFDSELLGNETGLVRYAKFNAIDTAGPTKIANNVLVAPTPAKFDLLGGSALGMASPVKRVEGGGHLNVGLLPNDKMGANSMSLSMWVKSNPGDIKNAYVASGETTGPRAQFTIGKGVANVANFGNAITGARISASTALNTQTWHNIIYVYNRANQKGEIWVNGTREAQGNLGLFDFSNWNFAIGAQQGGTFPFAGFIDDVSLWNIALDSAYIVKYYNKGLNGTEDNLVGYWKMDEGKNNFAFDRTDNDEHATLVGRPILVDWSLGDKAPVKNMALTDSLGNYIVQAINYGVNVNGNQFTVTPYFADNGILHTFNPQNVNRTLSFVETAHNGVDFTDQTVMPLQGFVKYYNSSCFVQYVEFMLNGQSLNPIAQTDNGGVWRFDSPLGIQRINPRSSTIQPDTLTLFVERPVAGLEFIDYESYEIRGTVTGNCGVVIGNSKIRVKSDNGCYDQMFDVNPDGTYLLDSVPPLLMELQVIPDNQLITFDPITFLHDRDTTINFVYRAPLQAEVIIDTAQTITDNCGNDLVVLNQFDRYFADILVFEEYDGGRRCYLDSADIQITNNISDLTTPIDTTLPGNTNGKLRYRFIAGIPNLGGVGSTQYQKSIEVTVTDSIGRQTVANQFAIVQGARQRASTFTTTSPDVVFHVLRDPPGDQSFSYIEKGDKFCRTFGVGGTIGIDVEFELSPQVGVDIAVGWVAEVDIEAQVKPTLGLKTSLGFEVSTEDEYCFELGQNIQTNADDLVVGSDADLFIGGALNFTFARLDILAYNSDSCKVNLSTSIGRSPEGIETLFNYTKKHVVEEVIPNLELLRDLPGQPQDSVDYWQTQVNGWNTTLAFNDQIKSAAAAYDQELPIGGSTYNQNVSFGFGAGYSAKEVVEETSKFNTKFNVDVENKIGLEFEVDIAGSGIEGKIELTRKLGFNFSSGVENSSSSEVGFTLADNEPGDFFSVNIKKDPIYGTFVFETVAGESMCPHEASTVAREKPVITVQQATMVNVPADEKAVFDVVISNFSESEEAQRYALAFWDGFSTGATITVNGMEISGDNNYAVFTIPGTLGSNALAFKVEVERAPNTYEHTNMVLAAFSDCEFGIYSSGGSFSSDAFSQVSINAFWEEPCADIALINPKEGWIVDNSSANQLAVSFTGYDTLNPTGINKFILQYRRKNGAWSQVGELNWSDLVGSGQFGNTPMFASIVWNISTTLPDGEYEVRIKALCPSTESSSDPAAGIISREAPTVFGLAQPSDGVLDPGDEISVTFNEELDCSKLNVESVKLRGVLSGFEYVSKAISLDGVDDYIEIPHISAYDFGSTNDFTLEFWVKSTFNQNDPCIISNKNWANGRNKGFAVSVYQGNRFRFNIADGVNMVNVNGPVIADNQWHHISIAVDRDFGIYIYKDGVLAARDSTGILNIGDVNTGLPLVFGQDGTTNYPYSWSGQLDEVRLWSNYRFQLNVLQGRFRSYDFDEANLLGLWRLDDGQGPFAFDRSTNANFGDLMNNPSWVLTDAAPISMEDVESIVDITFTCSGPKIVIEPVLDIKYLENSFFTATVVDAKDLHNNQIVQPYSWDFFVNQNPVSWENTNVSYAKLKHENLVITERLINDGPYLENYVLENVPAWLVPAKTQGQIPASFKENVVFSVDSFVNPGAYSVKLNAVTTKGWEPLFMDVNVMCPPPSWSVNAASYDNSMQVTGKLVIEGDTSADVYDMVAAYVGAEVRGVANIQKTSLGYFYFLTVYSNQLQGETITLSAWDASECKEYPLLDPTLTFTKDTLIGGVTNPLITSTNGVVVQEIRLNPGWNWFSLNVNADTAFGPIDVNTALATLSPVSGDVVKSHTANSPYYPQQDQWIGSLNSFNNRSMYSIKVTHPDVIRYAGYEVDPSDMLINVVPGWNHIGYPVSGNLNINLALSSLNSTLATGDVIKSQYGYAEYVAGDGWYGSLKFMEPGVGYMLKSANAGILAYPSVKASRARTLQNNEELIFDATYKKVIAKNNWEVSVPAFPAVSNITGKLFFADDKPVSETRVLIVAKYGEEVRGITHAIEVNNQPYFFMTYYTNPGEEGKITFSAYLESYDKTLTIIESTAMAANATEGSINEPFKWHLEDFNRDGATQVNAPADGFYLMQNNPNPFITNTEIVFGLPEATKASLVIYNTHGQVVRVLADKEFTEGQHRIIWDGNDNSGKEVLPGVYFYALQSGENYAAKKLVKLNHRTK